MNPHRGEVEIEIGGRVRKLRFDMNALAEIERLLGLQGIEATLNALSNMGFKEARAALWAGLRQDDPKLTLAQVGEWDVLTNNLSGLRLAIEKVNDAIRLAFGMADSIEPVLGEPKAPRE